MSEIKETAVQSYLTFLENPKVDGPAVEKLQTQLSTTNSPVAKLRLLGEIERVRATHGAMLEEGFVRHANTWATKNGVPASAFLTLGVDRGVLKKAGFTSLPAAVKTSKKTSKQLGNRKPRAQSVNGETIATLILATTEPFTIRYITEISNSTNATVSRVVGQLVAGKQVESIGRMDPTGTRGIAPLGYQVKTSKKKA